MGQYYMPVSIEKEQSVYSHDYGNGLKLMEHSWIGNNFVGVVERLISKGGDWFGTRIVWGGDYADGDVDANGVETGNFYQKFGENNIKPVFDKPKSRKLRYLVNLDKNEFVDLNKVPVTDVLYKKFKYRIHPLPLLTCEGNGRGGGDFRGNDPNGLVGKWARNRVVMETTKPKNCEELIFNLVE